MSNQYSVKPPSFHDIVRKLMLLIYHNFNNLAYRAHNIFHVLCQSSRVSSASFLYVRFTQIRRSYLHVFSFWQAKAIFTRRNTLRNASIIPVAFILLFASIPNAHGIIEAPGKVLCLHAEGYKHMHSAYNTIWIAVYFTLPALTLICFNIAIMVRLRKIKRIYKTMAGHHAALSMYGISQWSSNPPTGTRSTMKALMKSHQWVTQ